MDDIKPVRQGQAPPLPDVMTLDPATIGSAVLRRLIAEVQQAVAAADVPPVQGYNRGYNRHHRGPAPGGYDRAYNRHMRGM
jgi:hypothetical protein